MGAEIVAARASLHAWEEPCISGGSGSGTVFFCGCNLSCVYCQNHDISAGSWQAGWKKLTAAETADIFLCLEDKGAANINLVTPTHFAPGIASAIEIARDRGLKIPVVWNSSGYEDPDVLRNLDGLIDIYLADCKYYSSEPAERYSAAPDYFSWCSRALKEMVRQTGVPVFSQSLSAAEYNLIVGTSGDDVDDYAGPLMLRGTIVRHLILPGQELIKRTGSDGVTRCVPADSCHIIEYLLDTFGTDIYISLMNQYTPTPHLRDADVNSQKKRGWNEYPELMDRIDPEIYDALIDHALDCGLENGFFQGEGTDDTSFIPAFDGYGLDV